MAALGEILAELRKDKHLTQRELAKILHVSVGTISNYEQNVHFLDAEKLLEIADYFQITTDYLLGRCQYDFSPDVFKEPLVREKTVGDFIQDIKLLPQNRKEVLTLIINDMVFRAEVSRYREGE